METLYEWPSEGFEKDFITQGSLGGKMYQKVDQPREGFLIVTLMEQSTLYTLYWMFP